jgi:hypothetical protein
VYRANRSSETPAISPDTQANRFEQPAWRAADRLLIINDADDGRAAAHDIAGMEKCDVAPKSVLAVTQSRPPWRSTMALLTDSPIPRPADLVV